jgi:putative transcriptional regulator
MRIITILSVSAITSMGWIMSTSQITNAFLIVTNPRLTASTMTTKPTASTDDAALSSLSMAKNSDRAHIERNLEQMMGDDWRVFRAKLIAQERIAEEATIEPPTSTNKSRNKSESSNTSQNHNTDEKQQLSKHTQLSDLFAGAISSIFHSNHNNNENSSTNKNSKVKTSSSTTNDGNIFDGDTIGGVSSSSSPSSSSSTTYRRHQDFDTVDSSKFLSSLCASTSSYSSTSSSDNRDPFVSVEELPCHIPQTISTINKHRWAHEISHIETGCVLIANEKLGGVFHQTVVLIVQHSDKAGSIGIVINRYVFQFFTS